VYIKDRPRFLFGQLANPSGRSTCCALNHHDELLHVQGGARGLMPASCSLLDRAQHLLFHQEVDGFEQERHER
jgi:hypothetical protein